MRLAIVSPFVDKLHGTERALAELLERLANTYRCEIHLFAQSVKDISLTNLAKPHKPGSGAIFWHRVPTVPGPHVVGFIGWMVLNGIQRWWHCSFRGAPFDLVLSPGINCFSADVILVHAIFRRLRDLSLIRNSGDSASVGRLRAMHRKAYYKLLTSLERRAYSNRKISLVAVSERISQLLTKYFGRSDAVVALNGVDSNEFSPSQRIARRIEGRARRNFGDGDFVLLLIGNDWGVKGLSAVIEAMATLPNLNLQLIVVGSDDAAPFQQVADRLGIAHRCHWESPRVDVIDLYAAADVYVSPTLEDSFGLPIAEAMACGMPVITSVFAGIAGQIRNEIEGFVLADPMDAVALGDLIFRLYRDPELVRRIGVAAAMKSQLWTWDANAAAIFEVLTRRCLRSAS